MPPSRPVSSRRVPEDDPESILVHSYLMPKNIDEARTLSRAALHEVIGYIVVTALLLALGISSLVIWISSYVVPYGTYVLAECLVLNSTQTMLPEGFLRQPLYRAEVYIYVFNTSNPECCCQDLYGRNRCAEWEALAYDNILETAPSHMVKSTTQVRRCYVAGLSRANSLLPPNRHTAGSKVEFLRQYGYPGTFHKCWHSPGSLPALHFSLTHSCPLSVGHLSRGKNNLSDSTVSTGKDKVLMDRSSNSTFLIVPVLALTFGLWGLWSVGKKVRLYRAAHYYTNKYSGEVKDENVSAFPVPRLHDMRE
eukprot:2701349-Rhodomonas_salina.1